GSSTARPHLGKPYNSPSSRMETHHPLCKICHFDRRDGAFCRPGVEKSLFLSPRSHRLPQPRCSCRCSCLSRHQLCPPEISRTIAPTKFLASPNSISVLSR